jgi:hypothetical protein
VGGGAHVDHALGRAQRVQRALQVHARLRPQLVPAASHVGPHHHAQLAAALRGVRRVDEVRRQRALAHLRHRHLVRRLRETRSRTRAVRGAEPSRVGNPGRVDPPLSPKRKSP